MADKIKIAVAVLLVVAGLMALLLGLVGIYGVLAYTVAQKTKEIGIRMALGAQSANVLAMVLKQGLILATLGVLGPTRMDYPGTMANVAAVAMYIGEVLGNRAG